MPAAPAPLCRARVGDIELTYVPDGEIRTSPSVAYPATDPTSWERPDRYLDDDGLLVLSVGSILVRSSTYTVLIDLGAGPIRFDFAEASGGTRQGLMTGGALLDNLQALGVQPDDVDAVMFSHLHIDHVGWTTPAPDEARPTFPRATYFLSRAELEHWSNPEVSHHPSAPTPAQLEVIRGRTQYLTDGQTSIPCLSVLPTAGHTPGHSSFRVADAGQEALILGDAAHCPIELLDPSLQWLGDDDRDQAVQVRHALARHLGDTGALIVGPHFPDRIFGRLNPATGLHFDPGQSQF